MKIARAIPTQIRRDVVERANGRCERCSVSQQQVRLQFHHCQPWSRGGGHSPNNLEILCSPCHKERDREAGVLGRPRLPEGKGLVGKIVKLHPKCIAQLRELVPKGKRNQFIREAVAYALASPTRRDHEPGDTGP